jgi:hypothetical protein
VGLRRHVKKLLRETEQDVELVGLANVLDWSVDVDLTYTTAVPWPSLRKFAQFAYIAEQYGYRYAGLDPVLRDSSTPFFVFRRLPDAHERAARTRERFPDAPEGGRLPGMRAWPVPKLTLPEARGEVRLLHAEIAIDYYGSMLRSPLRPLLIGIPLVCLLAVLLDGELNARGLGAATGVATALLLLLGASRLFMRRRRAVHQRKLERSGLRWPP